MHLKGKEISEVFSNFSFRSSVLKLLIEHLEHNRDKVAQIDAEKGTSYTFAEILQQVESIAVGLIKAGIEPDDYVVICSSKSSLAFSIQLAVMLTGAIPVLIDVRSSNEIHKFTKRYLVKAVFCEKVHLISVNESLRHMKPEPTLVVPADVNDPKMKLLLQSSGEFSFFEVEDNKTKVVLVLFTSGSTSDPKGVQISDLGLQRLGYSFVDETIETYLLTSSFAWISSTISLVSSIFKGYTLILSEEKNPGSQLKIAEKFKANGWIVSAGSISQYPKDPSLPHVDLSSLKLVNLGGGVVKKRMRETFVSEVLKGKIGMQNIYGMTEIGVITNWRDRNPLDISKVDSSGYLSPGVEVKITDDQGTLVESGNIGEIRVKSLSMMVGYWGRPDLNDKVFDSDGFFRTGDAGYFDSDGFLYIVGRSSDIVTHLRAQVSVSEMADLVKCHPSVLDAAVIAKNQQFNDCDLIAFIVERSGCQVQEEGISIFVTENAGKTIKFKAVHKLEAIPRTYSNKIHQGQLHNIVEKLCYL